MEVSPTGVVRCSVFVFCSRCRWRVRWPVATRPSPPPPHTVPLILPSVTAVTDGPASGVGCVYGENLWADGGPAGHFDTVGTTLSDPSACGALGFGGGTRTFNVTYALAGGDATPYTYWFRGSRDRLDGGYTLDTLLERDSVADHDTIETGPLPMLLDGDYDAVGAALFLWADATLEASEEGFTDPSGTGRNYSLQLWAAKDEPVWDSARASGLVAAETTGPAAWWFVVIRGASRAALQATADEVLRALR